MKTKILLSLFVIFSTQLLLSQTPVSRVTVGLGLGANHLFKDVEEYSLTPDGNYRLQTEQTSRNNLVISPVIAFRLERFQVGPNNEMQEVTPPGAAPINAPWYDFCRFSILVSANILDLKSDNVGFNKKLDGGFGIGYAITPDIQLGVFYEVKSYRQLRNFVTENYNNASIPKGNSEVYNALDESDNNLFHDKTFDGISLKLIFNIESLN
jgi:hypothetical protein